MSKGYVYILINPASPYLLKIGKTIREPEERIKELSSVTGISSKFQLVYSSQVENCDLVEQIVHTKLNKYRTNIDREFFQAPIKLAIEIIFEVLNDLEKQITIDYNDIDKFTWWNSISQVWKQVLKAHIEISYEPTDLELIEAISPIIYDSHESELRKKVIELVKERTFRKKIRNWFEKLSNENRNTFKTYLMNNFDEENLDKIINLTKVDCFSHPEIDDLTPLVKLENLKELNCKDTNIRSLEPLKNNGNLQIIICNYTKINTLESLKGLKNLKEIDCFHTNINEKEIDDFRRMFPACVIKTDWI